MEQYSISFDEFIGILFNHKKVEISHKTEKIIIDSYNFLKDFSKNKVIYGVNTGFGPMAQYRIEEKDQLALQYNIIHSHSSGMGTYFSPEIVRSAILCRLNTLSLGKSGVHISLIHLMKELINRDITPLIFQHGSVGASGDLVQLAHLALVLIGEGEVFYKGKRRSTKEVFKEEGLKPLQIHLREGIALMNGTSVMTGIAVINVHYASLLLEWSIKLSIAINELVQTYDDHFSKELNAAKKHHGQQVIALKMRNYLSDSLLTRKRSEHLYTGEHKESVFKDKVQEYYSLRCLPQILGAIYDTICSAKEVVTNEFNSASDNPIVDLETQQVYHGGNFHGDYISLEMDKLKLAITRLSMLSERQLNYLLNPKINEILPAFVNAGKLGFNFGMQGIQFTATSTTAENQTLSNSMYVHSIPNNNDNQDIVSMGTNAATITHKVIENTFEVLAIEAITIAQAIDILGNKEKFSTTTQKWYQEIRKIIPFFSEDITPYPFLEKVKTFLKSNS
ncbi:aromatic amino acid ammonia-lyase [Capnocytophaga sp. G2]|uniref:HAL/PAL/TAL family ammonia-lyase n=1 Tax=Capnocytophaga sp. G2 TaxID=3110695 RepID=UPI002B489C7D|nr:aromatic amino acid ammonia-lyase [Capnocytophaga sp. G2]MEB3004441.1 aromatic amino acid ammonia-lyase [Capnocytophaga sp. G2]